MKRRLLLASSALALMPWRQADAQSKLLQAHAPTLSTGPYNTDVLAQSALVAFWQCCETSGTTFVDQKSGFNAAITGGVSLNNTNIVLSDTGKGALFNGSTGQALHTSASDLNFEYTQALTFEFSFKLTAYTPGSYQMIATKMDVSNNFRGWAIYVTDAVGGIPRLYFNLVNNNATHQINAYCGPVTLAAGTQYNVLIKYTGSGTAAGISFWVNGVLYSSSNNVDNLAGNTIQGSANTYIGARSDGNRFNGVLQYFAIYNTTLPNATAGQTSDDQVALFHYSMSLGRTAPVASLPAGVPNVWYDNDVGGDADNAASYGLVAVAHNAGQINMIGASTNDTLIYGPSVARALFDHYGVTGVEITAQQTATPTSGSQQWPATYGAVAGRWRAIDGTNKGCTVVGSIATPGVTFAVGDILTAVGGTLGASSIARPLKLQVATLGVGNSVATVSIYDCGSYATVPGNPVTFSGGSGTGFTLSGPTWTANNGNYSAPLQTMRRKIAASSNVVIFAEGLCNNLALLLASPANSGGDGLPSGATIISSHVAYLAIVGGWTPSDAVAGLGPQFNFTVDPVSANAVFASWPGPIIMGGLELTTVNPGVTAYIVSGPDSGLNPATNPLKDTFNQFFTDGDTPPLIPNTTAGGSADFTTVMLDLIQNGSAAVGANIRWGIVNGTYTVNASTAASAYTSLTAGQHSMIRKATADSVYAALANSRLATP